MSIGGRNHHRGSTVHVYRAIEAEAAGGLTRRTWVRTHESLRLALHAVTDATARRVFGEETEIEVTVMAPAVLDLRRDDAVIVTLGQSLGQRFLIVAARPLGRFTECALVGTPESIDETIAGVDADRTPLGNP